MIARAHAALKWFAKLQDAGKGAGPGGPGWAASLSPDRRRRWLLFLLPGSFVVFWLLNLAVGFETRTIGLDARIYFRGSAAWLAGQDPWAVTAQLGDRHFSYAGLPPTAIILAPFAVLPEDVFVWTWLLLSTFAAAILIRRLQLPLVWVLYPPLLYGVIAANPHVVVLALLLAGRTGGGAAATVLKVVAIPPLIGERRWPALVIAALAFGATALIAPGLWVSFLKSIGSIASTINAESGGGASAWGHPLLVVPTALALGLLAMIDFRAAGWLVIPALFPTTQYYYAIFALPVDPFVAAAMAFPWPGAPALVTIAYAIARLVEVRRGRRVAGSRAPTGVSSPRR